MEKAVFDDYVENRYKKQMEFYSKSSAKNQKRYRKFQWILIILSALTPVLAALDGKEFGSKEKPWTFDIQMIVVIIAAIVAILTTGLKTFSYQELWITYRVTYEKLKPEIHYYNFSVGPYADIGIDRESLFVARVEAMLDAEHTQWPPAKKLQEDQNRKENPPPAIGEGGNDGPPAGGGEPGNLVEAADDALLGEADEPREIVDESGESDEIADTDESGEPDVITRVDESGEPDLEEPNEPDEAALPGTGPKQA